MYRKVGVFVVYQHKDTAERIMIPIVGSKKACKGRVKAKRLARAAITKAKGA